VLALSRAPAPLWVLLDTAIFVALAGRRRVTRLFRHDRRAAAAAATVVVVAIALNRLWEAAYGPHMIIDFSPLSTSLSDGWRQLPDALDQQVGKFDYLEVTLPTIAYRAWGAIAVALGTIALLVGSRRERLVLVGAAAAALALPVLLVAAAMRHTGFGLQGRYVLPFSVVVPMLAGEILVRQRPRLAAIGAERIFLPFAGAVASIQLVAWWANAHRFAVGLGGPRWFVPDAQWVPPGSWWPWLVAVVAGAALLVALDGIERRRRRIAAA
jgi:hypothetical protein